MLHGGGGGALPLSGPLHPKSSIASDKRRSLDISPNVKSARVESRLEALGVWGGSRDWAPGASLAQPASHGWPAQCPARPWVSTSPGTGVEPGAAGARRQAKAEPGGRQPCRPSCTPWHPSPLGPPRHHPSTSGRSFQPFPFARGKPRDRLTVHMISVTLAVTHVILALAQSRDETGPPWPPLEPLFPFGEANVTVAPGSSGPSEGARDAAEPSVKHRAAATTQHGRAEVPGLRTLALDPSGLGSACG